MRMEIIVDNLEKDYKEIKAVDHISFSVEKGEVYGIIGPNGAGKTTLMEIMLGLRKQDRGTVTIQGMDTVKDHKKLVYHVGAQLQQSELPTNIKVKEAVKLQAALFKKKIDVNQMLEDFNLREKAGAYCSKLSGGQRQRLFILLAVIHDPDIVFFDELSTGLDPVSRQDVWNYVGRLKNRGKTIIVSTHYMQEAEQICDRIMLVNNGRIVDIGTSETLTEKLPFSHVLDFEIDGKEEGFMKDLAAMEGFLSYENLNNQKYRIFVKKDFSIDRLLSNKKFKIRGFASRESQFEDYFYYKVKMEEQKNGGNF